MGKMPGFTAEASVYTTRNQYRMPGASRALTGNTAVSQTSVAQAPVSAAAPPVEYVANTGFTEWLSQSRGSVAISTYQASKLFMVGLVGKQINVSSWPFEVPTGFDVRGDRLVLATRHDVTVFHNSMAAARPPIHDIPDQFECYDAMFSPCMIYHTGYLHTHDVAIASDEIWLVAARLSCLATLSDEVTFVPRWRPAFVSETVPEDRCHLNGLALRDDRPAYVTALGESDTARGWRENKVTGGIVIDVERNEIVLRGLAMPHSPRWYQGYVWLVNSGKGQLLRLDVPSGQAEVICELPGYLRGLAFVGRHALVGLSKIRPNSRTFGGMPIETRYNKLVCGVGVVDVERGQQVGLFEFASGCTELYDVRFLPGIRRPDILTVDNLPPRQVLSPHRASLPPDFSPWRFSALA